MYRMVIIDLDGTLFNDEKEVSKEDADMINRAYEEKGVISVIATGRSYMCAKYVADIVGDCFSQYIIASTGSIVRDNKNNIDLNRNCISNEDMIKIMDLFKEYNFRCMVDIGPKVLSNGRLVSQKNLEKIGQPYEIIENMEECFLNNKTDGITITLVGEQKDLLKVTEKLNELRSLQITDICESIDVTETERNRIKYIDIISKGSTKQNAIMMLENHLNINKEEIIVIGDGGNDIPMFEMAGLKVAMENGLDIVKQKADYITANNNESGVGKAIKKFIFDEN